jgi:hypothetical protein
VNDGTASNAITTSTIGFLIEPPIGQRASGRRLLKVPQL